MKPGIWMQLAAATQVLAGDLIAADCGVGAILSPRDLNLKRCKEHAESLRALGASLLYDHQFYFSDFQNGNLLSFETAEFRQSISHLRNLDDAEIARFQSQLEGIEIALNTEAILSPAVIFEPGDQRRIDLNYRLYTAAKAVGNQLGVPTYATVVLSRAFGSTDFIDDVLSSISSAEPDGFYFAFESNDDRICANPNAIYLQLYAGLLLRSQNKPLLHAYAGPMGLLSPTFGATGIALAPHLNSWGFSRQRFEPPPPQNSRRGAAKPLYFSGNLWGNVSFPEELTMLSDETIPYVVTPTEWVPYDSPPWPDKLEKGKAERHLVQVMAERIDSLRQMSPLSAITQVKAFMHSASVVADNIEHESAVLKHDPRLYLSAWDHAATKLKEECSGFLQEL